MKYRKLGNTGLIVSEVALGTMQFGGKMNMGNLGQEDTTLMVKASPGVAPGRTVVRRQSRHCVASVEYASPPFGDILILRRTETCIRAVTGEDGTTFTP
jgi:hypothetical protein